MHVCLLCLSEFLVAGFLVQLVEGLATLDVSHVSPRECTAVQTDERDQRPTPSVGRFSVLI